MGGRGEGSFRLSFYQLVFSGLKAWYPRWRNWSGELMGRVQPRGFLFPFFFILGPFFISIMETRVRVFSSFIFSERATWGLGRGGLWGFLGAKLVGRLFFVFQRPVFESRFRLLLLMVQVWRLVAFLWCCKFFHLRGRGKGCKFEAEGQIETESNLKDKVGD